MKKAKFLQTAGIVAVAAIVLASCSSRRHYHSYPPPPPPRPAFSLILSTGPGMVINRYPNGRYYYRNPQGHIYWRGHDNRFYLDRKYIRKSYHNHHQYNDWRRYQRRR